MPKQSRARLAPMDRAKAQSTFLAAFAQCAVLKHAAEMAGVDRRSVYGWLESDPEFAAAYEEAREQANDTIRAEIWRRAVVGWVEPVYQKGMKVGTVRKYDPGLLMFLAKARMPEYREKLDITTSGRAIGNQYIAIIQDPTAADLACQLLERAAIDSEHPGGLGENRESELSGAEPYRVTESEAD